MYTNHKVKALNVMLPKTSSYVKSYDGQTAYIDKWIYCLMEDDELLEKYITIWGKVKRI